MNAALSDVRPIIASPAFLQRAEVTTDGELAETAGRGRHALVLFGDMLTPSLTGGTHANSQSFEPGEVAVALNRCSPIEFVGSSAASTDEE
jgi:hypothetical protein